MTQTVRRSFLIAAAGIVAFCILAGCASGPPPAETQPAASGGCAFDVRNETGDALSVTAGGAEVRRLGTLQPGRSVRFRESCDLDEVTITATTTQPSAPGFSRPGSGPRDRAIKREASPRPGHVVQVVLRFPEQTGRP